MVGDVAWSPGLSALLALSTFAPCLSQSVADSNRKHALAPSSKEGLSLESVPLLFNLSPWIFYSGTAFVMGIITALVVRCLLRACVCQRNVLGKQDKERNSIQHTPSSQRTYPSGFRGWSPIAWSPIAALQEASQRSNNNDVLMLRPIEEIEEHERPETVDEAAARIIAEAKPEPSTKKKFTYQLTLSKTVTGKRFSGVLHLNLHQHKLSITREGLQRNYQRNYHIPDVQLKASSTLPTLVILTSSSTGKVTQQMLWFQRALHRQTVLNLCKHYMKEDNKNQADLDVSAQDKHDGGEGAAMESGGSGEESLESSDSSENWMPNKGLSFSAAGKDNTRNSESSANSSGPENEHHHEHQSLQNDDISPIKFLDQKTPENVKVMQNASELSATLGSLYDHTPIQNLHRAHESGQFLLSEIKETLGADSAGRQRPSSEQPDLHHVKSLPLPFSPSPKTEGSHESSPESPEMNSDRTHASGGSDSQSSDGGKKGKRSQSRRVSPVKFQDVTITPVDSDDAPEKEVSDRKDVSPVQLCMTGIMASPHGGSILDQSRSPPDFSDDGVCIGRTPANTPSGMLGGFNRKLKNVGIARQQNEQTNRNTHPGILGSELALRPCPALHEEEELEELEEEDEQDHDA